MSNIDRITRKTVPLQVPKMPSQAQIVGSTRKDLLPTASAIDHANEEWRKRLQLALETAIATALIGVSTGTGTVGEQGPQGEQGPRGPQGIQGPPGSDGSSGFSYPIDGGAAASVYGGLVPVDFGFAATSFGGVTLDLGGAT